MIIQIRVLSFDPYHVNIANETISILLQTEIIIVTKHVMPGSWLFFAVLQLYT